jgi:hypothetical protein
MLIYSMSVSVDGFIADREGAFGWRIARPISWPSTRLWGVALGRREGGGALARSADEAAVRLVVVGDRDPPCPGERAAGAG